MKDDRPVRILETVKSAANAEMRKVGSSYRNLREAFGANLMRFGSGRSKTTVVVEIGARLVKIAGFETVGGAPRMAALAVKSLPSNSADIPIFIESVFNELGLRKGRVVAVFPRSKAIVRYISVPSRDHAEIEKMVSLQADRLSPFDRDEAVIDFHIVASRADGFSIRVFMTSVER